MLLMSGRIGDLLDRVLPAFDRGTGDGYGKKTQMTSGTEIPDTSKETSAEISEEDDILNNKNRWRIIVAGYIVFILVTVFLIISMITLNNKINTLYRSVQDMEYRINTMEPVPGDG